jgi:DNA-binding NtrC family response regulator
MMGNHKMRIYLVSNEPIIGKTLQNFLSNLGHEAVPIKSACELLEKLWNESQPDVIIGDFYISEDRAVTLIRELHKRYPDTAIVPMTVDKPIISAQEAISYGVYAYLRKPIHLYELELLLVRLSEYRAKI